MSTISLPKLFKNAKRATTIIKTFAKYGFGFLLEEMHIKIPFRRAKAEIEDLSLAKRTRMAFEELGPTVIKLGQILGTRSDLFPEDFIEEFAKLQDDVRLFEYEEAKKIIRQDLKKEVDQIFREINPVPEASASIAQVYRATLQDGTEVAVKVQRPDIKEIIEEDVSILYGLASLLEKNIPESRLYEPNKIVDEFSHTIQHELNFNEEGSNIEQFKRNFDKDEKIYIPKVFWDYTSERVLTLEYVKGTRLSKILNSPADPVRNKKIARNGAAIILKQVFVDGMFHADPHPGNLIVLDGNVLAFLDFGQVGFLDDELKDLLIDYLLAILDRDSQKIVKILKEMGTVDIENDMGELRRDLDLFLAHYYNLPVNRINIGELMTEIFRISRSHKVRIPTNLLLLEKTIVTMEGVTRKLDPEFNLIEEIKPFARELTQFRYDPERVFKKMIDNLYDFRSLFYSLPQNLKVLIQKLEKGSLRINVKNNDLEEVIKESKNARDRFSLAILIGFLVLAGSVLIAFDQGPQVWNYSVFGILHYFLALFLGGIYVFEKIFRR